LWNLAFYQRGTSQVSFGEDVFIWIVTETAKEVGAIIITAEETSSTDFNDLVLGGLDMTKCWTDTSDVRCSIEVI
jgi:hypothetical protein